MTKIRIQDESGDKRYFTILPNYIANHSTANDQALYFQMKRYAGEDGKCFATEKTMMRKLRIGKRAYDKSLKYLLSKEWIEFVGLTGGKTRPIKTYKIKDIWKENNDLYEKISAESTLSSKEKISAENEGDKCQMQHKISAESNIEEEHIIKKNQEEDMYGFSEFWNKYPKKIKKKDSALKWKSKELNRFLPEILLFIDNASKTDRWKKGFIPDPPTFLNQERWNDEVEGYNDKKREVSKITYGQN